uniref:SFRICE_011070 n=1 Tax=Spodoptera frugiperda TaxID=7108 RepID=A0A2H1V7Q9_SPOFR
MVDETKWLPNDRLLPGEVSTISISLLYVLRNRNESAFGVLIGWFSRAGQSECRMRSPFVKSKLVPRVQINSSVMFISDEIFYP